MILFYDNPFMWAYVYNPTFGSTLELKGPLNDTAPDSGGVSAETMVGSTIGAPQVGNIQQNRKGEASQGVTTFSSAKIQGNLPMLFFLITPSILLLQSHVICETLPRTIFCHIINLTMSHRLSAWNVHLQLQLGKF